MKIIRLIAMLFVLLGCLTLGVAHLSADAERLEASVAAELQAALPNPAERGPYPTGRIQVSVPRATGGSFGAFVYYPATSEGLDTPFDPSGGPYPGVALSHGLFSDPLGLDENGRHIASYGMLVINLASYQGIPDVAAYARDVTYSLDYLEAVNADSSSAFYDQVDTDAFGALGHSMGGGSTIIATADDPRIKAALPMAAGDMLPSAVARMDEVHVPIALLSGSADNVATPENDQIPMYLAGNAPKLLPIFIGADHCVFALNEGGCGGWMSDERQAELTKQWMAAFFNLYLRDEYVYAYYVWGPGMTQAADVYTELDAGFTIAPFIQTGSGGQGTVQSYTVTVENRDDAPNRFALVPYLNEWPVSLSATETPLLLPGQSFDVTLDVTVPLAATGNDIFLIAAISAADGATSQFSIVKTAVE